MLLVLSQSFSGRGKITDKQEPRAARRDRPERTFTGWTDDALYVRAAKHPKGRCSYVMVLKGPFSIVVHKDGFAMVNVLCRHVSQCGYRLAGRASVGMEVHGNGRFRGQWMIHQGRGT